MHLIVIYLLLLFSRGQHRPANTKYKALSLGFIRTCKKIFTLMPNGKTINWPITALGSEPWVEIISCDNSDASQSCSFNR